MPISHEKKCIFVHIQRTAGSSIRAYLGLTRDLNPHNSAEELQYLYGKDAWNSYFTFSCVRNPWDRMVSGYFYFKSEDPVKSGLVNLTKQGEILLDTFQNYLKSRYSHIKTLPPSSISFLCDKNKTLLVDYIIRYEKFDKDFEYVCNELKITPKNRDKIYHKTDHLHYRDYYDEETKDIVENYYKEDIETFNYEF